MLIDTKLRISSAKAFLPVSFLLIVSLNAGAFTGLGDTSGVSVAKQSKFKELNILKSVGLMKTTRLKQAKAAPEGQEGGATAEPSVPVRFSGYVRSFVQFRDMDKYYNDMYGGKRNFAINGVNYIDNLQNGYPEPLVMLQADVAPTPKSSLQVQYSFDNQMTGQRGDSGRQGLIYRMFNLKGNIYSKFGLFSLTAGGGVNWARMTPLTLGNNLQYYRQEMFERLPWQFYGSSSARYNTYYEDLNIAVDTRWSRAGTQGFLLEGSGLPAGFGFLALYGKTDNSGGFRSYVQTNNSPIKNVVAGRLYNNYFGHEIGVNYFNQFGYTNAYQLYPEAQTIGTVDLKLRPKNLVINLEVGAGSYKSPDVKQKWTPAANLNIQVDKKVIGLPFSFHAYQIGASVVNINSDVLNSSVPYVQPTYPIQNGKSNLFGSSDITTFPGAITEVGQMTNNRQGVDFQANHAFGKLKISFGYGLNQEVENKFSEDKRYNQISFYHKLNAFTRSRFAFFQNGMGPYGAITNIFRRTFEKVDITDTSVNYKKSYNVVDLSLKYKFTLFKKDFILMNYTNYSSAQDKIAAIPMTDDQAFVRYFYEELMGFYAIHTKIALVGFVGFETVKANKRTTLVDANADITTDLVNGKPRDQVGTGYGIGIDYDFARTAGLYFRHRWFDHQDKNFTKDQFKGQESSVELKIFF